ncbi:hypothetical protein KDK77_09270 [bacterium]|nr:hypothetical protein [bacterium]
MKKILNILVLVLSGVFIFVMKAESDEIRLKTGRVIEGEIVDETETTVKINLGYGIVGFNRDRIEEIIRSSDAEKTELNKKLEEKRQEAINSAQENEQWYDKESHRQELIDKQKDKQTQIKLKREEILQKRKEQIERMREEREKGIEAIQQGDAEINPNIPPPPPLPGFEQENTEVPAESTPDIPQAEPEQLAPEESLQPEPEPEPEPADDSNDSSERGGRRIHRLRNR